MSNKTITLDRELVSRIVGLRPDYTCAQLDADEELVRAALAEPVPPACCKCGKPTACGKMICEECCYEPLPVPPVGGEVEVRTLAYAAKDRDTWPELSFTWLKRFDTLRKHDTYQIFELVDRAHVTRLQAEVECHRVEAELFHSKQRLAESHLQKARDELTRLKSVWAETNTKVIDFRDLLMDVACSDDWVISSELRKRILDTLSVFDTPGQAPADSYAAIRKERDDLQSELTKAREALQEIISACCDENSHGYISMVAEDALSNQSAPADKGQGEPVCYLVNDRFGGKAYLEEGSEALAIRRRLGFTDEIALYADQPAPVAVVMPFDFEHPLSKERRTVTLTKRDVFDGMEDYFYDKISEQICQCESVGETNVVDCNCDEYVHDFEIVQACLDEVARLNSEPKP